MITWILAADSSVARIYSRVDGLQAVALVREIKDAKGRARASDLVSDRPGRLRGRMGQSSVSAVDPHTDPTEVEHKQFARRLAHVLRHEHDVGHFHSLALVAPPHFLGLLRHAMPEPLARVVVASVPKEGPALDADSIVRVVEEKLLTA